MEVDTLRMRALEEGDEVGEREVEVVGEKGMIAELEERLERLSRLERDDELDALLLVTGKTAEIVGAVHELEHADRVAKAAAGFESRLREAVLGSDRDPVNRRERRFLDRARAKALRRR